MNRKSIFFISFLALSIFLITILYFSVKIGLTTSEGKDASREQFSLFVQKTLDLIEKNQGLSDTFTNTYISTIDQMESIGAVLVSNANTVYFAHPLNSSLLKLDANSNYTIQTNSAIVSVYSTTIPLDLNTAVTITAALYHITPATLYSYARSAFMIILITTLAVFFVLLIQNIASKNSSNTGSNLFSSKPLKDTPIDVPISFTLDSSEDPVIDEVVEEQLDILTNTEETISSASVTNNNVQSESILGPKVSDPLGLFSKETGFGWESYLETRLDSELARAASSEQDLALIIVRIQDLSRKTPHISRIASVLFETFKFRDLIFEYGSDGFACIVQEIDLDMAMKIAEKLYGELQTTLQESFINNKIGIGISTRTLRIIPGSRILQESSQACDKSFEEEGLPIVAFRVSPDKYRKFLSEVE